jgi:hypothetical protein
MGTPGPRTGTVPADVGAADRSYRQWTSRSAVWRACLAISAVYAAALGSWSFLRPGWNSVRVETAWIIFAFVVLLVLAGFLFGDLTERPAVTASHRLPAIWLIAAAALGSLAYSRALTLGFLSDDFSLVNLQAGVTGWTNGDSQVWRPIPLAVFWLANRVLGDYSAPALHLLNIALHFLCAWLVWRIAILVGAPKVTSLLAMFLFLTFPASVESVAWCAGLQDLLATTATLLFVTFALEQRAAVLLLGALVLGLLSKESAVVSPVLAAMLLWASSAKAVKRQTVGALCVAVLLAGSFSWWRLQTAGPAFAAAPSRYLLKKVTSNAFGTLAVPWTAAELRHAPILGIYMALLIAVAGLSIATLRGRPRHARLMFTALLWPVVAILPAYSIFFVAGNLEGGRLLYTACAGWAVALALTCSTMSGLAAIGMRAAIALVVGIWTISTYGHVLVWQQASMVRDQVLASAQTLPLENCAATEFVGVPDNFSGAYVFRNGFHDALKRRGHDFVAGPGGCRFVWTGTSFEREQ